MLSHLNCTSRILSLHTYKDLPAELIMLSLPKSVQQERQQPAMKITKVKCREQTSNTASDLGITSPVGLSKTFACYKSRSDAGFLARMRLPKGSYNLLRQ